MGVKEEEILGKLCDTLAGMIFKYTSENIPSKNPSPLQAAVNLEPKKVASIESSGSTPRCAEHEDKKIPQEAKLDKAAQRKAKKEAKKNRKEKNAAKSTKGKETLMESSAGTSCDKTEGSDDGIKAECKQQKKVDDVGKHVQISIEPKTEEISKDKVSSVTNAVIQKSDNAFFQNAETSFPVGKSEELNTIRSSVESTTSVHKNNSKEKLKDLPNVVPEDKEGNVLPPSGKSKAELKRERREKQEAQRTAKHATKAMKQEKTKELKIEAEMKPKDDESVKPSKVKASVVPAKELESVHHLPLFGHLTAQTAVVLSPDDMSYIHPAIRSLGKRIKDRIIDGCNARVVATLQAVKKIIRDYHTPSSCDLNRDLTDKLTPNLQFLNQCRITPAPVENALRFIQREINSIGPDVSEIQAKELLINSIDKYVAYHIVLASQTITAHASSIINENDVILTFGYSSLVYSMVSSVVNSGKVIKVIVVDDPNRPTGYNLSMKLASLGITVYYRLISDLSKIMTKATKIIVEADGVLLNGAILGPCGLASLAVVGAYHCLPVIVLCHTYKFCNIDLTDSIVFNELGDIDSLVQKRQLKDKDSLRNWKDIPNLNIVSLVYDVTPAHLITALVTELNVLPTSAVPVVIKHNYADILGHD